MDKFGIFKLLNSFLNPPTSSDGQTAEQNSNSSATPADFLSGLLSSLKNNNNTAQNEQKPSPINSTPVNAQRTNSPLQRQMLSTMSAHDQIINRVNKNKVTPR